MKIYFLTFFVVIIDQFSKFWVKANFSVWESQEILGSFLKFSHVKNPGLAFGISVGKWGMLITILSLLATLFIGYVHWKERFHHSLATAGLSLILGGAIGNLIDRSSIFFVQHYEGVVDFIDIGIGMHRWYTFNIADSAVTIGVFLYLLHSMITNKTNFANDVN